ncbi:MAG: hypothetical protein ACE145_03000 [Terriglobia bacterium]
MLNRRGVVSLARVSAALIAFSLAMPNLRAQSQEKGLTFYEEYRGSTNSFGQTTVLDLSGGYNFNQHFGVDVGIPLSFVHREYQNLPASLTPNGWNTNAGDLYLNLRFNAPNRYVNYTSQARTFAPTGSFEDGFSTGRVTVDWNNHFDRSFGPITPFVEASLGNTIGDRHYLVRPFRSLGLVSQLETGADVKVASNVFAGGSWYGVLPSGTQKIYSQLVPESPGFVVVPLNPARPFQSDFRTIGPSDIAKDNGLSGWVGVKTSKNIDFELGYSRSMHYDLDTFSFRIGYNPGSLVKRITSRF